MDRTVELREILKKLKLSGALATLPDRVAYAKGVRLSYEEFFELIVSDELERRQHNSLMRRLKNANLNVDETLERFDWNAPIRIDRDKIKELFSLGFIDRGQNVILCGPAGVGKSFLANALGHSACRKGKRVLRLRASQLFKKLNQSRGDNSYEKELLKLIELNLLIIDDFAIERFTEQQVSDLYELVVERYGRYSTILTSGRHIEEWMPLFNEPIIANSVLDRLAQRAYQLFIEGDSYRQKNG